MTETFKAFTEVIKKYEQEIKDLRRISKDNDFSFSLSYDAINDSVWYGDTYIDILDKDEDIDTNKKWLETRIVSDVNSLEEK